ncbi:PACE efflux transporter [Falsirhodobacter sp. alg1]|uniref:PACE efflux transporter n=1 Tax=Falsirhodobacter sp. alg1 TaxID=1472418 RepID=UPI000786B4DA|nr:PACE efflux transporter [Falsirhodobacter sp. alg1]
MRTTRDRIRHALSFEITGLLLIVPVGSFAFGMHMADMGVVALVCSIVATLWNFVYNIGFDRFMKWWRSTVHKTLTIRVVHTVLFEFGLLAFTLPFLAIYLQIGIWQALIMDIGFVIFYLVFAFFFNLIYDHVFALPKDA